jgi:lipopolysaccharide export system protein LptA
MSRPTIVSRIAIACVIGTGAAGASTAQESAAIIEFDAESLSLDFEANAMVVESIRVTDGNVSVSAAKGTRVAASEVTEEWSLSGDVVVAVDTTVARADTATLRFSSGQLVRSELGGEPVEIERLGEEPFRGSATRIAYDDVEGVFSATGNASFSMGAQQVHCDWVYDVRSRSARGSPGNDRPCRYLLTRTAP